MIGKRTPIGLIVTLSCCQYVIGCKASTANESTNIPETQPDLGTLAICSEIDASGCRTAVAANLEAVQANIETVSAGIKPPSVGTLTVSTKLMLGGDFVPAEQVRDMVNNNMEGTPRVLGWVYDGLVAARQVLLVAAEGHEGIIKEDLGDRSYVIKSDTNYELYFKGTAPDETDRFTRIDGNTYHIELWRKPLQEYPGHYVVKMTYIDENHWELESTSYPSICEQVPRMITSRVQKNGNLWHGKIMTHFMVQGQTDCNSTPTADDTFSYTQFIGDDEYTTAAGYMPPLNLENLENLDDYDVGLMAPGGSMEATNPVCCQTGEPPLANTACPSDNPDISAPNFKDPPSWETPFILATVKPLFPDGLQFTGEPIVIERYVKTSGQDDSKDDSDDEGGDDSKNEGGDDSEEKK